MLRFDSPVQATARAASEDVEYGGVSIPKGAIVVCRNRRGQRDPAVFPEPDRFDVARRDNHHLSFGFGAHFAWARRSRGSRARSRSGRCSNGSRSWRSPSRRSSGGRTRSCAACRGSRSGLEPLATAALELRSTSRASAFSVSNTPLPPAPHASKSGSLPVGFSASRRLSTGDGVREIALVVLDHDRDLVAGRSPARAG